MKLIQRIFQRVACVGALLAGLILTLAWLPGISGLAARLGGFYGDGAFSMQLLAGLLLTAVGVLALWPVDGWGRRRRRLVFPCSHGEVSIQLRSIEDTLTREVGALPEVRRIHVRVLPTTDPRKVAIKADVVLRKGLGSSAPELADSVNRSLEELAKNIFGVEEITFVKLRVDDIILEGGRDRSKVLDDHAEPAADSAAVNAEPPEAPEAGAANEPEAETGGDDWRKTPGAVFTESLPSDDNDENNIFDPARSRGDEGDDDADEDNARDDAEGAAGGADETREERPDPGR